MIRSIHLADSERLKELHRAQGFDYPLPTMGAFRIKRAYEHDGRLVMAILARPTVELYMISDPNWASPAMRYHALRELHEDVRQQLVEAGIDSAVMWIPPEKEKSFGRRLMRCFGWVPVRWKCMARFTNA